MQQPAIATFRTTRWFGTELWRLNTTTLTYEWRSWLFFRGTRTIPLITVGNRFITAASTPRITQISCLAAALAGALWAYLVWFRHEDQRDLDIVAATCILNSIIAGVIVVFTRRTVVIFGQPNLTITYAPWQFNAVHSFLVVVMDQANHINCPATGTADAPPIHALRI